MICFPILHCFTGTEAIMLLPKRQWINSLAPGKFEWNFRYLILQIISVIDRWGICYELALRRMSLDLTDDKSILVQVMAWCHQATSYYLSQCWPRSLSPYGVTRPNELILKNMAKTDQYQTQQNTTRCAPCAYLLGFIVNRAWAAIHWYQNTLKHNNEQTRCIILISERHFTELICGV